MKKTTGVISVAVILLASACGGRSQAQTVSTAVAGTVVAQISATAQLQACRPL